MRRRSVTPRAARASGWAHSTPQRCAVLATPVCTIALCWDCLPATCALREPGLAQPLLSTRAPSKARPACLPALQEAALAYDAAARRIRGAAAICNFNDQVGAEVGLAGPALPLPTGSGPNLGAGWPHASCCQPAESPWPLHSRSLSGASVGGSAAERALLRARPGGCRRRRSSWRSTGHPRCQKMRRVSLAATGPAWRSALVL